MLQWSASALEATDRTTGLALARITHLLESFGAELVDHPQRVRFMAQFDAMYARDWPAERLIARAAADLASEFDAPAFAS